MGDHAAYGRKSLDMAASMERALFPEMVPSKDDSKVWIRELVKSSRWYLRLRIGSRKKRMLIWLSVLFLSRCEKNEVNMYLNLKWRYWWIKYTNEGTLIKVVWVQGRGSPRSFKERSRVKEQDAMDLDPAERARSDYYF